MNCVLETEQSRTGAPTHRPPELCCLLEQGREGGAGKEEQGARRVPPPLSSTAPQRQPRMPEPTPEGGKHAPILDHSLCLRLETDSLQPQDPLSHCSHALVCKAPHRTLTAGPCPHVLSKRCPLHAPSSH